MAEDSGEFEIDLSSYDFDSVTPEDFMHDSDSAPEEPPAARPVTPWLNMYDDMRQSDRTRELTSDDWAKIAAEQRMVDAWDREHYGPGRQADGPATPRPEVPDWSPQDVTDVLDQLAAGTIRQTVPTVCLVGSMGVGLFYPAAVNGIAGESGGGKTWIALAAGVEQMKAGNAFFYIDYEDSLRTAVLRLVQILRVDPALVRSLFRYVHPEVHSEAGVASLVAVVEAEPGAFVVIDSTGESLASAGLNQNADDEVARWFHDLARPLADAGATVCLLDHMTKSQDTGRTSPIGSQRKKSAINGAQYIVHALQPFSRNANGSLMLVVAKDRHGAYETGSTAAIVRFTHPTTTLGTDGVTYEVVTDEALTISFESGKTPAQLQADKAAKAQQQLDADVTEVDRMTPPPTSYRQVMDAMSWGDARARAATKAWKDRRQSR